MARTGDRRRGGEHADLALQLPDFGLEAAAAHGRGRLVASAARRRLCPVLVRRHPTATASSRAGGGRRVEHHPRGAARLPQHQPRRVVGRGHVLGEQAAPRLRAPPARGARAVAARGCRHQQHLMLLRLVPRATARASLCTVSAPGQCSAHAPSVVPLGVAAGAVAHARQLARPRGRAAIPGLALASAAPRRPEPVRVAAPRRRLGLEDRRLLEQEDGALRLRAFALRPHAFTGRLRKLHFVQDSRHSNAEMVTRDWVPRRAR